MPTDLRAACVVLALLAIAPCAGAQDATPAMTASPAQVEGAGWYEAAKRERDRVRLLKGFACADPATTRVAPAEIEQILEQFPARTAPGYVAASRAHTVPMASYPSDQLDAGNPGAALVMIAIRDDGSVQDARAVCATADGFADRSRETALRNRYHAARVGGAPVASVVFQMVTYGIGED
jgi:hypothetical protein